MSCNDFDPNKDMNICEYLHKNDIYVSSLSLSFGRLSGPLSLSRSLALSLYPSRISLSFPREAFGSALSLPP